MKVKVKHPNPGHHPKFGRLEEGQIIEVPEDFDISGDLFEKVSVSRKKEEVREDEHR